MANPTSDQGRQTTQRERRLRRVGGAKRNEVVCARQSYERRAWGDAYQAFVLADQKTSLTADDLDRFAMAAYLTGRDHDYLKILERAYAAHRDIGQRLRAVRCAFWLGFRLLMRGERGRATGWLARAERLLACDTRECAERGYLLLTVVEQRIDSLDYEAAYAGAAEAAAVGERCGDLDLVACARHQQGRIRLQQGQIESGLALLDETMVMVTAGELSPLVTGLMYCSVIAACHQVYALDRTREWTAALTRWCEGQPDMVAFTGVCQVHRAEIMQMRGAWPEAVAEARRACARSQGIDRRATAAALYRQAEVHRLKGELAAAETAYRDASHLGLEPQPGLALLRLAQERPDRAATAIRRATTTTTDRLKRMSLLPAYIEIVLAVGDREEARSACEELEAIARSFDTDVPGAMAAEARGAVELAGGCAQAALGALRCAFEVWERIEVPYAAARVRLLIGLACRALGDEDGAALELEAARSVFERLGAAPDVARIDALTQDVSSSASHPLTTREVQVLRLVSAGKTNAAIAAELFLSERTVERHLSNIFTKLDLPTRTAATAWAFQHGLI
jgi:DNA-binding CsgD family transcriptional regulator